MGETTEIMELNPMLVECYGVENARYLYEKYGDVIDRIQMPYGKDAEVSREVAENRFRKEVTKYILNNKQKSGDVKDYIGSIKDYKYSFENDDKEENILLNEQLKSIFLETLFGDNRSENDNFYISMAKVIGSNNNLNKLTGQILDNYKSRSSVESLMSGAIVKKQPSYSKEKDVLYKYILNGKNIDDNDKKQLIFTKAFENGNIEEFSELVATYDEIYNNRKKNKDIAGLVNKKDLDKLKLLEKMFTNENADSSVVSKCIDKIENINEYIKDIQLNSDMANKYLWNSVLFDPKSKASKEIKIDNDSKGVKEITLNGQEFNILCHMFSKEGCRKGAEHNKNKLNTYDNPEHFSKAKHILSASLIRHDFLKHYNISAGKSESDNLYSVEEQFVEHYNSYGFGFSNVPIENYASFCSEDAFSNDDGDSIEIENKNAKGLITPNKIIEESKDKDSINEIVLIRETEGGALKPDYIVYFSDGLVDRSQTSYREAYDLAKRMDLPIVVINEKQYKKDKSKDMEYDRI